MHPRARIANILVAATLCLLATAAAAATPYSKWSEQFSRWKSRPLQGTSYGLTVGGPGGSTLVAFSRSGMMRSFDGGATWDPFTVQGQSAGGFDVAIAPGDARLWYVYSFADSTLRRTTDGGVTWSTRGEPLPAGRDLNGLAVSSEPDVLYRTLYEYDCNFGDCIETNGMLQVSKDAGTTWQDIGSRFAFQVAYPSPAAASVVFALSDDGLQRSADQGTTWTNVSPAPLATHAASAGRLALDRFDPAIAYLVASAGDLSTSLFSTRDGGITWSVTTLPGGKLFADAGQGRRAYLFTFQAGAYETRDGGSTWVRVDPPVYTSINANVSGVVLRGGRRIAVAADADGLRELDLTDGAVALASDLWWKPDESGWGLTITHRASTQTFVEWYAYDEGGNPVWRVVPGGTWSDRTFSGDLYETAASKYFGGRFDPAAVTRRKVGTVRIAFDNENHAVFSYQLASGDSGSKRIERQLFAAPTWMTLVQESYADLWWNAAEPGWGIAINHQNENIFATWFAYDDAGRPSWLVMPDAKAVLVNGVATAVGDVYTTSGPAAFSTFDTAQVARSKVGTATLVFPSKDEAVLSSVVFGRTESRAITRQPF